jgi:hypothetical protein
MILPLHELPKLFPAEELHETGCAIYPVHADNSILEILELYRAADSEEERDAFETKLIHASCFHEKSRDYTSFVLKRIELVFEIAKTQKELQAAFQAAKEEELKQFECQLTKLDIETAKALWMTDSEMEVHRDSEEKGLVLPPIWSRLVSLIRKEYCFMADTLQTMVQRDARTIGGCDETRFDMLRHTVCLLKYYGFSCTKDSIHHPLQLAKDKSGGFSYNLRNPTWEHIEDEIRTDLTNASDPDAQMPPRYPDTPKGEPSPLKTPETQQKAYFMVGVASEAFKMSKDYKERPFF